MPYQPPTRGHRPLRSRARFEQALRAADLSAAELARVATALGAKTTRQNMANIRNGSTRSVRAELAAAIERALHVEKGDLFGRIGAEPPEDTDDVEEEAVLG